MPREFIVPASYLSSAVTTLKRRRTELDPKRKDLSPALLDFGPVRFLIARHFGFCYGVQNAIEIAYRAIENNQGKRIFLLSEMIHNPEVNEDLLRRGVKFLMDTTGQELIPFSELTADDVVIVPAFGTTLEIQQQLDSRGIDPFHYDTTCPFVEKVWKRSSELGAKGFSVVVHGKRTHEETRATFSHSKQSAPTVIVRDMEDTLFLIQFLKGTRSSAEFLSHFAGAMSADFDPTRHLTRVGVVNQTTMLATETAAIAQAIRQAMVDLYGTEHISDHFADTNDTLCYATYENQSATKELLNAGADLALVIGGYNSSNTSHLVELCEERLPTYYIRNASEIESPERINHFEMRSASRVLTAKWLPIEKSPLTIAITSGASCPDSIVEEVIAKIVTFFPESKVVEDAYANAYSSSLSK